MDFKKDYYRILEVGRQASKEEIKASFRRLAKLHHPDKNGSDAAVEERFKEINEAYDVLSNDVSKHVYDEFKRKEEALKAQEQEAHKAATVAEKNRRTHTIKRTIRTEKRLYVYGQIVVKFYGELQEADSLTQQREVHFRVLPTDVQVTITESNIHPLDKVPQHFQKSYSESELFKTPIVQPVKCTILSGTGEEFYELELKDIRIRGPRLEGVTKHESQSFGTLIGELFAYTPKIETEEITETVSECHGTSGNVEYKEEGGFQYKRTEYYHKDCSTYWSPWEKMVPPKPPGKGRTGPGGSGTGIRREPEGCLSEVGGCLQWWWLLSVLGFALAFPQFLLGLLAIGVIGLVLYFAGSLLSLMGRVLPILALIILIVLFGAAVRSCSSVVSAPMPVSTPRYDTLSSSRHPVSEPVPSTPGDTASLDQNLKPDTLISHFIRWKDYDSVAYETTLSVLSSHLTSSVQWHQGITNYNMSSIGGVYQYLMGEDTVKLNRIYAAFDSIKAQQKMTDRQFAEMMVSCIQSIPYYLVVDKGCAPGEYEDDYIRGYLNQCQTECCIGNMKYGVRSPIEFMSDLKGDCDTRALLIYTLLKHYNYNVALLASDYYKHAVVAVSFADESGVSGLSMNIRNKNYYLWETTNTGLRPGFISPAMQDLDYWDIALLHENN